MHEQLLSTALVLPGYKPLRFGLVDDLCLEVARLDRADPAIVEAFRWLELRGLAVEKL